MNLPGCAAPFYVSLRCCFNNKTWGPQASVNTWLGERGGPMENREVVEPYTRIERYEYLSRTHDLGGSPKEISRLSQLALD